MKKKIYFLIILLSIFSFAAWAQTEVEPNDSYTQANAITHLTSKTGTINCSGDANDYFKGAIPQGRQLKIYFEATNTGASNGYVYFSMYDKSQNGIVTNYLIKNTFNLAPSITYFDTLTINCRSDDSLYFKISGGTQCFNYKITFQEIANGANVSIDTGDNSSFTTANYFNNTDSIVGAINYSSNGSTDADDYYKTYTQLDGLVRVYIERTNTGPSNSQYCYLALYNKNSSNFYNSLNGYVNTGETRYDTIDLYCRAADTTYFRLHSATTCFQYKIRYEVLNNFTPAFDNANNDAFSVAAYFNKTDTVKGQIQYTNNATTDADDYYKTYTQSDGILRVYIERTNNGNSSSQYFYLALYNKNKNLFYNSLNGYVNAGQTRYDTIDLYCRAADTTYFRLHSATSCFQYKIRYEVLNNFTPAFDNANNDSFSVAAYFNKTDTIIGQIQYSNDATADAEDYYKTYTESDGILRVYIERTNNGTSASQYFYLALYNKNKNNFYNNINGYVNAGQTRYDTIDLYCRAADTTYFRVYYATTCFQYKIRYEVLNNFTPAFDNANNDSFSVAAYFNKTDTIKGQIQYSNNSTADADDYYKTYTQSDGILRVYIERTNTGTSASQYFYLALYDKNKNNFYNNLNGYVNAGQTRYDTIDLHCRAADTTYFRVYSSTTCFQYKIRYEVLGNFTPAFDNANNDSFSVAAYFHKTDTIKGQIQYSNTSTTDADDYYKTYTQSDGILRVYIERTNTGTSASQYFYLALYDKNKNNIYNNLNGYVNAGQTRYDTIDLYCRAADTTYFRVYSATTCFQYKIRYEVIATHNGISLIDTVSNESFATATYFNAKDSILGNIKYAKAGVTDDDDYFKTYVPYKGTLRVYIERTNTNNVNGQYVYLTLYNQNQSSFYNHYDGFVNAGTTRYDTLNFYCRNADTMYFRLNSATSCFSYKLRYELTLGADTTLNVCPGFTTDISKLYNTAPFNSVTYTNMGGGAMPPLTAVPNGLYRLTVEYTPQSCSKDTAYITVGLYPKPNIGNDTTVNVCPSFTADLTTLKNTTGLTTQWIGTSTPTAVGPGIYTLIVTNIQGCMDTAIITVGLNPKPNIGNDTTVNICPGFTTDITGLKNTSGLTTQWIGTSTPTAVGPGIYTLIVTNTQGCMDTTIITVGLNPKPNIGNDTTVNTCPGFTTDITGLKNTSGLTTQWIGTSTPTTVNNGIYTLIVTNTQGCMDTAIITVGLNPKPNLGNDTTVNICPGFTTDITGLKNTSGLTTQWIGTSTPTTVNNGIYTLIVTNTQGCMDTAIITVGLNPKPNLGNDTTVYAWLGESVNFVNIKDTTGFGAMGWTQQWTSNINGNSGNTIVNISGADTVYASLVITSSTSCKDTTNIIIYPVKNIVPAIGGTGYNANVEITDATSGWTNYYNNNGTVANKADDILLLSLKKNGNAIGTIGDGTFTLNNTASTNAGNNLGVQITNPLMSNPTNYYVMHRYWKVVATNQPTTSVGVRFYYNTQDFNDANGSFSNTKTLQQMVFYHLKDGNPDPSTNWAGATLPVVSITNGAMANDTTWIYSLFGLGKHRAEFTVSSFSGGGGGFTGNNNILPLNEVKFNATANKKDAVLKWMTTNEENVAQYEIEQSTDGNKFEQIGTQPTKGGTNNAYQFTAKGIGEQYNIVYYRLKLVLANNNHSYTTIARVLFAPTGYEVTIIPNPASTKINIIGADEHDGLIVLDMNGKAVITQTTIGKNKTVDVSNLAQGNYIVQIIHQNITYYIKLFKE